MSQLFFPLTRLQVDKVVTFMLCSDDVSDYVFEAGFRYVRKF